jgi:hypothetical protein
LINADGAFAEMRFVGRKRHQGSPKGPTKFGARTG